MIKNEELIKKYNIEYIDNRRYYYVDLNIDCNYEHSIPILLYIDDYLIETKSWGRIIVNIVNHALDLNLTNDEELLSIKYDWTSQNGFSKIEKIKSSFIKCKNDLYANTNFNSTQLVKIIKYLLNRFFNKSSYKLLVCKRPNTEPNEVLSYYKETNKSLLKKDLIEKNYSINKANIILLLIEKINILFKKYSKSQIDLLYFDSYKEYKRVITRFIDYLKSAKGCDQKSYLNTKLVLNLLYEFYKKEY